jgi:hypothetical protein
MFRSIQEIQPTWIVAENVPGILSIEQGVVFERCVLKWKLKGTKSNRLLFHLSPRTQTTSEIGCGLLHTPRATEIEEDQAVFVKRMGDRSDKCFPNLATQIKGLLRTPTAGDGTHNHCLAPSVLKGETTLMLSHQLLMIPTPTARDFRSGFSPTSGKLEERMNHSRGVNLVEHFQREKVGLKLQPAFALWMMSFPEDWTVLPFLNGEQNP